MNTFRSNIRIKSAAGHTEIVEILKQAGAKE